MNLSTVVVHPDNRDLAVTMRASSPAAFPLPPGSVSAHIRHGDDKRNEMSLQVCGGGPCSTRNVSTYPISVLLLPTYFAGRECVL